MELTWFGNRKTFKKPFVCTKKAVGQTVYQITSGLGLLISAILRSFEFDGYVWQTR